MRDAKLMGFLTRHSTKSLFITKFQEGRESGRKHAYPNSGQAYAAIALSRHSGTRKRRLIDLTPSLAGAQAEAGSEARAKYSLS